jgi:hypothetical protein
MTAQTNVRLNMPMSVQMSAYRAYPLSPYP